MGPTPNLWAVLMASLMLAFGAAYEARDIALKAGGVDASTGGPMSAHGHNGFQQQDWDSVPVEQVAAGVERQMVWGDQLMVCRLKIAPWTVTAVHAHPHEQITLVERGTVRFIVEGQERISSPGDVLHFPSHCAHGATMLDEEVVLIDIFSPVRRDFLPTMQTGE